MPRTEGEIVINRPVEEVFDVVADERNVYDPRIVRAEKISPGRIGVGTRFRSETRGVGRTVPMNVEITAYERPCRLSSTTSLSGMQIDAVLFFDSVPEGTRMRWRSNVHPRSVMKLLSPLLARIGKRQVQRIWGELKRVLEAKGRSPTPT